MMMKSLLKDERGGDEQKNKDEAEEDGYVDHQSKSTLDKNVFKVKSDPFGELAVKNAKYMKNCTELYLANKGIEELAGFEKFVNLEVLWLNDNELKAITNLDNNFRIKSLIAHNNQITTLQGSLKRFKFLENLHLFNNNISNLEKTLGYLCRLNHLKVLDLFDNPVAQEENYRLRVIHAMPKTLTILDRHHIRDEERLEAKRIFGKKGGEKPSNTDIVVQDDTSNKKMVVRPPSELVGELSGCTLILLEEVERILANREMKDCPEVDDETTTTTFPKQEDIYEKVPKPSFWKQPTVKNNNNNDDQLSEWEIYNARKTFYALFDKKTRFLSYDKVRECIRAMEEQLARTLTHGDYVLHQIHEDLKPKKELDDDDFQEEPDKYPIEEFNFPSDVTIDALVKAGWTRWTQELCIKRSNECFTKAYKKHMKSGSTKPHEKKKNSKEGKRAKVNNNNNVDEAKNEAKYEIAKREIMHAASTGYRLSSIYSKQTSSKVQHDDQTRKSQTPKVETLFAVGGEQRYDTFKSFSRYSNTFIDNTRDISHNNNNNNNTNNKKKKINRNQLQKYKINIQSSSSKIKKK